MQDTINGKTFSRLEQVVCPICGAQRQPRTIPVRFGMNASVAYCEPCRVGFQTPRPSLEASIAYMDWRWSSEDNYVSKTRTKGETVSSEFNSLVTVKPEPGRLLDFGAGSGAFVRTAIDHGWDAHGVEHSPGAVARAAQDYGVTLTTGVPDGEYDVITLWDVVEHLREPAELVGMLRTRLKPGGLIIMTTGNYESWQRIAAGDRWGLYLFDHQYYFTPTSLERLLVNAGFERARILPEPGQKPKLSRFFSSPARAWRERSAFRQARRLWPEHHDINIMTMVAFRPN